MSDNPQSISSLTTEFLDQPPSCLEFYPNDPGYFVLGTYLLHENPERTEGNEGNTTIKQTKTGTLQLWHLDATVSVLRQKQVISLSHAVFDLHFHPRKRTVFGIAGSDGTVSLFSVSHCNSNDNNNEEQAQQADLQIQHIWTRSVHEDPSIPALYLAWFPQDWFPIHDTTTTQLNNTDGFAVTFSDGRTSVFSTITAGQEGGSSSGNDIIKSNRGLDLIETRFESPQDRIEIWFVALASYAEEEEDTQSANRSSFIFTGDDFGSLTTRKFSTPELDDTDDHQIQTGSLEDCILFKTNDRARHHTAGVTAILPLPIANLINNVPVLLTGSYDEYIRVYHATPKGSVLAEKQLGGGVWRLQVIQTRKLARETERSGEDVHFLILASCMHAGTRIVNVTWTREQSDPEAIGDWDIQILAQFTEHESMNYASDVWKGSGSASDFVCVSSSFYDKRLCLWRVQI